MDTLEELQKKQNAVSPPSQRLHNYLAKLDKPDMIDSFTAANVLCVYMCLCFTLQLRSEKEKQAAVIETSPQISIVPLRARRSVPVCWCVGMCLCVCMWAHATLFLSWIPSHPSTISLHAGMMLTVPAFLWTLLHLSTVVTLGRWSRQRTPCVPVHTEN